MAAAVAEPGPSPERGWGRNNRVKRTAAMPAHSLFGSSLENQDERLTEEMRSIDLEAYDRQKLERSQKPKPDLPDSLRQKLPGNAILEHTKEQLQMQKMKTKRARELINSLEQKAKYFELPNEAGQNENSGKKRVEWMPMNDVDRAEEAHPQPPQPASHQYALVGSVFTKGNDVMMGQRTQYQVHPSSAYTGHRIPKRRPHPPEQPETRASHSAPPSAMDLPPNIRHMFGTKVCGVVLSDSQKVQNAIDEQRRMKEITHRKRKPKPIQSSPNDDANPDYESLGQALRQNVCPGYTYDHKNSTTKSDYTKNVHQSRVPDPDEYRYQRDELSTWAEQNVLRERMKKAWETFLADVPKPK